MIPFCGFLRGDARFVRRFLRAWPRAVGAGAIALLLATRTLSAQTPQQLVDLMLAHEMDASKSRDHYMYLSKERSDRTGGHLWTEKVAETTAGKVRMLIEEDGQPLSSERVAVERARLADIVAHPDAFTKKEMATKSDEAHAQQMLDLLPKAFLFENPRPDGGFTRIDFRPNPDYSPQSLEERVLHAMIGSMLIEPRAVRLHEVSGRLPQDVSIGFGFLATIHAGSNFSTRRDLVSGNEWKTALIDTDINGRAIFFKSVGRKEHAEHADFSRLPNDLTLAQAVELLEK